MCISLFLCVDNSKLRQLPLASKQDNRSLSDVVNGTSKVAEASIMNEHIWEVFQWSICVSRGLVEGVTLMDCLEVLVNVTRSFTLNTHCLSYPHFQILFFFLKTITLKKLVNSNLIPRMSRFLKLV